MEISVVDVSQQTLAEIVPLARKLSTHDKLVLIQVLADELLKQELLRPLKQIRAIEMWTPYDTVGAAQVLAQELTKTSDETPESKVDHAIPILGSQLVAG